MVQPLLEVRNLQVAYGDSQAVWDVSFDVGQGEVVALIGANGAGKTTVLRAISRLVAARAGVVRYGGKEVGKLTPEEVVGLGIIHAPEGRQLWPDMTVLEHLELGAFTPKARKLRAQTQRQVFELFPRLLERLHQKAGTLSGGEQQMCAIARCLMAQPRLLMLDEPSLGLAPMLVRDVFDTVKRIVRSGVTVLLVEQNVRQALQISSRAYVLETGRVTLSGSSEELSHNELVYKSYMGVGAT